MWRGEKQVPIMLLKTVEREEETGEGKQPLRRFPQNTNAQGKCWLDAKTTVHFRSQRPRSFWSAPRIATSGPLQRHSSFEWLCKYNRDQNQSDLSDLTVSMRRVTGSPWISDFRCWTWPEVVILGADQRECGLWGGECKNYYITLWSKNTLNSAHAQILTLLTTKGIRLLVLVVNAFKLYFTALKYYLSWD